VDFIKLLSVKTDTAFCVVLEAKMSIVYLKEQQQRGPKTNGREKIKLWTVNDRQSGDEAATACMRTG